MAHSPSLIAAAAAAKSLQLCPTLCDPIAGSPPGSLVPGILQARTLVYLKNKLKTQNDFSVKRVSPSLAILYTKNWKKAWEK